MSRLSPAELKQENVENSTSAVSYSYDPQFVSYYIARLSSFSPFAEAVMELVTAPVDTCGHILGNNISYTRTILLAVGLEYSRAQTACSICHVDDHDPTPPHVHDGDEAMDVDVFDVKTSVA